MSVPLPRSRALWFVLALAFALLGAVAPSAMAHRGGALYTQTNDPAGNTVQRFDRAPDGALSPAGTFATGGAGLAGLGGRQGAVELSGDGRDLYAVNAGSDSVSAFRVGHRRTHLIGAFPSRGVAPASVAEHRGRVYVLNSGGTPSVAAFSRRFDGSLEPIPGGTASWRRAPRALRTSPSRPTAARSSSASASRTGSRRCRSTASGARRRRW